MQKLTSLLTVIVTVLPSAMGENFLLWNIDDEYETNIKISENDPNQYNRVIPVVVFPNETVELSLSCVNVNFNGDENANVKWTVGDLKYKKLNDDKVEITVTDDLKTARWSREFLIREGDKGVQTVYCQYDDGETRDPSIDVQFEVYVKLGEDDTTLTFGQGTSEEPRAEVAENIKAQLEKKYGNGNVRQENKNEFIVNVPKKNEDNGGNENVDDGDGDDTGSSTGTTVGIVFGCLLGALAVFAYPVYRLVVTGNCGWFSQKYSDYVQASPGDEESFWGCFAKNSDSGSEVKMDNLMKTDK